MPRSARIVAPGVAHHVTQRGTDRQTVFFSNADRRVYLELLQEQTKLADVRILAYCLMLNHIHLVAVPEDAADLAICMRRVHGRYAQYLNGRRLRTGHLWQNRYFSCPLDQRRLWVALRYVELNPVRADLVNRAEEYRWSSAAAHLAGEDASRVLDMKFAEQSGGVEGWRQMLACEEGSDERKLLRRATYSGQPHGSNEFIEQWSASGRRPATSASGVGGWVEAAAC